MIPPSFLFPAKNACHSPLFRPVIQPPNSPPVSEKYFQWEPPPPQNIFTNRPVIQNALHNMPKSEPAPPSDDPSLDEHWFPTEGAAYRAALLVTNEGKCAKEIALAIYGHCRPRELGRVAAS